MVAQANKKTTSKNTTNEIEKMTTVYIWKVMHSIEIPSLPWKLWYSTEVNVSFHNEFVHEASRWASYWDFAWWPWYFHGI